jgi:regulator of RNase E activity RraB
MAERAGVAELFDQHWATWIEQRAIRSANGDDLTAVRQVEHFLFFQRRLPARRARIALNTTRAVRVSKTDGRPRWILEAIAPDDLRDDSVRHSITYMLTIAEMYHGEYDGFGAPVVSGP